MVRMIRTSAFLVLAAWLFPSPALAQSEWERQVNEQLRQAGTVFEADGYALAGEVQTGTLNQQASADIDVTLQAGVGHMIIAVCDDDCSDIDLRLLDGAGNEVDSDFEDDAFPIVSVTPAQTALYRVHVYMANCTSQPCFYGVGVYSQGGVAQAVGSGERHEGRLVSSDRTLGSGEYYDVYTINGRSGEQVVVDLRSSEFDPYLIVIAPDDEQFENDDHEGDAGRSLVSLQVPQDGEYRVVVTSYKAGETGAYDLRIDRPGTSRAGARVERGSLAAGDRQLGTGEYYDTYTFEGQPGQHARLDVSSTQFDTYLILVDPSDEHQENDDAEGLPGHSVIETEITDVGTYTVGVTSYKPGEGGAYELSMELGAASPRAAQRDVVTLALGGGTSGRLESGDQQLESGEWGDVYVFEGTEGTSISVELTSSEFDPYLQVQTPSGEKIDNDDYEGSRNRSRVDLTLRESGRYRVLATSYQAGETGGYQLSLSGGGAAVAAAAVAAAPAVSTGTGKIFGVFVGIGDYPGEQNDLSFTAEDARRAYSALTQVGLRSEDAVVLTDAQATRGGVQTALGSLGGRMGPNDVLVFFFSGHGNRVPRSGPQAADPDAIDETLVLYDGDLSDDEMNATFANLSAGTSVFILDACFSGGFVKDVITVPGRMGLFSSEEMVTSSVAAKFRAGGYLAVFLADAVGNGLADVDGDGAISAIELTQYVHERYREDVKSAGPGEVVRTGGPQLGYQHLVTDLGSIGAYDVLFRLAEPR
jgi:hypothetical protein